MPEKKRQKKQGVDKNKKNQARRRRTPQSTNARGSARQKELST
jgi:hypothetical protein